MFTSYIPQLAKVDGKLFGISVTTVDGQQHSIGDVKYPFVFNLVVNQYLIVLP